MMEASTISCVKKIAETRTLPSNYAYYTNNGEISSCAHHEYCIPTIDLSLLTSNHPKPIQELDKACQEWGFFMVVNHGIPEELLTGIIEAVDEFFNLAEEDKPEFQPKDVLNPIRYGTSFNTAKENIFYWRDFLKLLVHPQFHSPNKPQSLRQLLPEYCAKIRDVATKLLQGISKSLGIEHDIMENELKLRSRFQNFVANMYPACPNPDIALGFPPHSDHGLLTLLIQNQVCGLQIQHMGKWINVNPLPNSILVNIGDQLEIFSNGKYKSVLHRAVVNSKKTRISIVTVNGPALDAVVHPLPGPGLDSKYVAMKYKDYMMLQQSNPIIGKSCLERLGIH